MVGSRASADRAGLHEHLDARPGARPTTRSRPSYRCGSRLGDEFQGCFATVGEALHASLLAAGARCCPTHAAPRHRLGAWPCWRSEPAVEDGPGWWAARAAIEAAAERRGRATQRWLRTAYVVADDAAGAPDPGAGERRAGAAGRDGHRPVGAFAVGAAWSAVDDVTPARARRGVGASAPRRCRSGCAPTDWRRSSPPTSCSCLLIRARRAGEESDELARDPADRLRRDRPDPLRAPHPLPARVRRCPGGALSSACSRA